MVLYSTLFVSTASHARVCADAVRIFGLSRGGEKKRLWWVQFFSVLFPIFCLFVYVFIRAPVALILASGVMQAIMLPMLGAAALFFRYRRSDPRIPGGVLSEILLWLSTAALTITGVWALWSRIRP